MKKINICDSEIFVEYKDPIKKCNQNNTPNISKEEIRDEGLSRTTSKLCYNFKIFNDSQLLASNSVSKNQSKHNLNIKSINKPLLFDPSFNSFTKIYPNLNSRNHVSFTQNADKENKDFNNFNLYAAINNKNVKNDFINNFEKPNTKKIKITKRKTKHNSSLNLKLNKEHIKNTNELNLFEKTKYVKNFTSINNFDDAENKIIKNNLMLNNNFSSLNSLDQKKELSTTSSKNNFQQFFPNKSIN